MTLFVRGSLTATAVCLVWAGCSNPTGPASEPSAQSAILDRAPSVLQKAVTHSVTGAGHFCFFGEEEYNDQWSFTAKVVDGKVMGQVQYRDREMGYTFHGVVFQLMVDGKMAKIGWKARRTPTFPGGEELTYGFVVVVDNGEGGGKGVVMDQVSWGTLADASGAYGASLEDILTMNAHEYLLWLVDTGADPPLFSYAAGNIQVR